MMDDELGRLMVVNKMVCEYCVFEWYSYYIVILKCIISCHRLKIWVMQKMNWFMHSGRKWLVGILVNVQANHGDSPTHAQCFSH